MIYMIIGIVCVSIIGFIAHRVGICLVRAVKLAMDRQPGLLIAILMSGMWVGAYLLLANYNQWQQPFIRYAFHPLFALGGFLFGVGASVNQGCSVSTMHQFALGNTSMIFTMIGWFFGWCLWLSVMMMGDVSFDYQIQAKLDASFVERMFILSVSFTVLVLVFFPKERSRWIGISLIGLLVSVLFYIEPMWAPSKLIQDLGAAIFEGKTPPSQYRSILVIMMLFGMWASVWLLSDSKFRLPTMHKIVRHGVAGTIMGFGGAMALGGNDSQILMGLPTLSLGAITAVLFMLLGIACEQILYHRGQLFYQKR